MTYGHGHPGLQEKGVLAGSCKLSANQPYVRHLKGDGRNGQDRHFFSLRPISPSG